MNKTKYIFVLLIIIVLGVVFLTYRSVSNKNYSVNNPSTVSILSLVDETSTASAVLAGAKTVSWQTNNYPAGAGVDINLIRKISDSPIEYTVVRRIIANTPNDGKETWIPQAGENSADLYVEVTCSDSYQFTAKCSLATDPIKVN